MDDNHLYPIGDVARRTGLSVSAIRFYADEGVIAPTSHTRAGHRLYDVDAIARLELVRTLRELGASLDDIRELLAEGTTLRQLAATHLALVERQLRDLSARRAVLRTIVNQHTEPEQVALMHNLVSMSDDDRARLIGEFWDEVTDGLTIPPYLVEQLHQLRPDLPEEPTTEQLQAWIELAELVRDGAFRREVRQFLHKGFGTPMPVDLATPAMLARIEEHRRAEVEARTAELSGLSPDSPRAREIAERLVDSLAGLTAEATGRPLGEHEIAELRRSMAEPDPTGAVERHVERAVAEYTDLFDRFLTLMDTINGTAQWDVLGAGPSDEWIAAALTPPASTTRPAATGR
ncbi:DNA-binding transcriptional MerR regulator [Saccharothrix coeruleofusca]|uniref:MerR family transcriptional regulator n=1 Tax=Saccharothrix coeruleofusca TaxID=33919 RepID=UPI001AE82A79|nr:MerR family transcriptional regulator [Saccharothrix coeruleofusca]MBP2335149.1 DNA-binding transcriptional MerR regulator [Saccharothrix coeruleofusca]